MNTKLTRLQNEHGTDITPPRFYRLKASAQWRAAQQAADETGAMVEAFSARKSYTIHPKQEQK